jgi:SPP1 gp7 family putative phage head morphogenesis protein
VTETKDKSKTKKDLDSTSTGTAKLFSMMAAGRVAPRRGTSELIEAYSEIPILRIIVQRIAESVASVPFNIQVRKTNAGTVRRDKHYERLPQVYKDRLAERYKSEQTLEVYWEDPILDFIDVGNGLLSGFDIRQLMQTYFELTGTAIARIQRTAMGVPESLWPMPPHWIASFPVAEGDPYVVRLSGRDIKIPYKDIFLLRDPNPTSPYLMGSGIGASLGDELDTDVYIASFVKAFFLNYANPDTIIAFEDQHQDDLKRLQTEWQDRYRGAVRAHGTHFISPMPEVTTITPTFRDMNLIELRRYIRDISRETWGIPPEIIGIIENSNRATIDAASYIFARWVALPRLERWRMALQDQIVSQIDTRKIIGYLSPIPEDKEYKLQAASASPYTLTINEWRAIQGVPPRPDGDVYLQVSQTLGQPPPQTQSQSGSAEVGKDLADDPDPDPDPEIVHKALVDKLDRLADKLDPEDLAKELEVWQDLINEVGEATLEDLPTEHNFDPTDQAIRRHADEFLGARLGDINTESRKMLKDTLLEGIGAGESMKDLTKRVSDLFGDMESTRAKVIAQTEVNRTANFAKAESYVQSGVVAQKKWISALDARTRPDHLTMNSADPVPLDGYFTLPDGSTTLYPGNTGVAAQDINCRCTTVPITAVGVEYDFDALVAKEIEQEKIIEGLRERWEVKAEKAFRKAFKSQAKKVLTAMENINLL